MHEKKENGIQTVKQKEGLPEYEEKAVLEAEKPPRGIQQRENLAMLAAGAAPLLLEEEDTSDYVDDDIEEDSDTYSDFSAEEGAEEEAPAEAAEEAAEGEAEAYGGMRFAPLPPLSQGRRRSYSSRTQVARPHPLQLQTAL